MLSGRTTFRASEPAGRPARAGSTRAKWRDFTWPVVSPPGKEGGSHNEARAGDLRNPSVSGSAWAPANLTRTAVCVGNTITLEGTSRGRGHASAAGLASQYFVLVLSLLRYEYFANALEQTAIARDRIHGGTLRLRGNPAHIVALLALSASWKDGEVSAFLVLRGKSQRRTNATVGSWSFAPAASNSFSAPKSGTHGGPRPVSGQ